MATVLLPPSLSGNGTPASQQAKLLPAEPPQEKESPQQTVPTVLQIPDRLWKPVEEDIEIYLQNELFMAEGERQDFVRKLARWKLAYRAPMAEEPKHFPLHNSSNLTIPLIKESVNTLAAQLVQLTLTARPFWMIQDLAEEWDPFIHDIEDFLDIAADRDMNLSKTAIGWIVETVKLGTGIVEVGYDYDVRKVYDYSSDGKRVFPREVIRKDGPGVYHLPLQSFWIRWRETNLQEARWCAKQLWFTPTDMIEKAAKKEWFNVDDVLKGHQRTDADLVVEMEEKVEKTTPIYKPRYEIFKVNLSWDIDGDGKYEELVIYYSKDARKIVSRQFLPFWHGKRPYVKLGYFPHEHRFYDEGLCEMLEDLQGGITDKHNKRADGETMANLKMFVKRKLVKGLMPGDPLWTGKVIEVNDIWNDLRELQMSEIHPSTVQEEEIMRTYADRLSGLSDANRGSAMPVSRTTAYAQAALLQEQAKRVDLAVRDVRAGLNEIAWFATQLYFQYGTNGKALMWMGERGKIVEGVFRLPRRVSELGLAIKAGVPTSMQNRETKRQNAIQMFNLLVQVYQEIMPLAQMLTPQQLPEVVHGMVDGAIKFMRQVFDSFDQSNPEEILAGLLTLEKVLPAPEDLGGVDSYERTAESSAILDKLTRLEGVLKEAEANARRDNGVRSGGGGTGRVQPSQGGPPRLGPGPIFGGESLIRR